ncbi:DUF2628 domain-containing protein [Alkalilimnicola ehrlichii]|nr:hypothetical protein [Alkalilimnicola ehrlichii]
MKTFNMFHHPHHGHKAVKVGFSWPGFFFGIIWAAIKGLWWLVGCLSA